MDQPPLFSHLQQLPPRQVPLLQVCDSAQKLLNSAVAQAAQEDGQDPLSGFSLERVQSLSAGTQKALSLLRKESALFSDGADLSEYTLEHLSGTLSDIREASRKLAIVLSAGPAQFKNQQQQDAQTLQSLNSYLAAEVAEVICVPELAELLRALDLVDKTGSPLFAGGGLGGGLYGTKPGGGGVFHASSNLQCQQPSRVNTAVCLKEDFNQEIFAAGTLTKLSKHFAKLAEHCEQIAAKRSDEWAQKGAKKVQAEELRGQVKELVPLLRSHVLRVGIGKGQHHDISSGSAKVSTIASLFSYLAVEDVHRQLEACRDQLLQEITMRKLRAKMAECTSKPQTASSDEAA